MKVALSLKQFLILTIAIFIVAYISIIMSEALKNYASTGADWVSALIQALGNVTGGIIGGIVAYLVAAFQIQRQTEIQHQEHIKGVITKLKLIRHELKDNLAILETVIPYSTEQNYLIKATFDDIWKCSLGYLYVSDKLIEKLDAAYRKIVLLKLIKEDEVNDDLVEGTKKLVCDAMNLIDIEIKECEKKITK